MTELETGLDDEAEDVKVQRETKAKLQAKTEDDDLKWLMSSRRGRRIAWGLLSRAGVFRPSFSTDALVMSFNEGTKEEGRRLLSRIQTTCFDLYIEMTKENVK